MKHVFFDPEGNYVEVFSTAQRYPRNVGEVIAAPEMVFQEIKPVELHRGEGTKLETLTAIGVLGKIYSPDPNVTAADYFPILSQYEREEAGDFGEPEPRRFKFWKLRVATEKLSFYFFDRRLEEYNSGGGPSETCGINSTIILPNDVGLNLELAIPEAEGDTGETTIELSQWINEDKYQSCMLDVYNFKTRESRDFNWSRPL